MAAEQDAARKQATRWALEVGLKKVRGAGGERRSPSRARRGARQGRRARAVEDPQHAGARRGRVGQRRRRAHAARGDRVLPRDRDPAGRAVGHVRDLRVRHLQPAQPDQDRDGRAGVARSRDQARRRRRGADPRPDRHVRLPQPAREDERGHRRRGLAPHGRRGRVRRRRLPEDRRPQEGADHLGGRQEHVAGQHRGQDQGVEPDHRPGDRHRRRASLQRGVDHARSGRGPGVQRPARASGHSIEALGGNPR